MIHRIDRRKRPKRKAIPHAVKLAVCERQKFECSCGCGEVVSPRTHSGTQFDHEPALKLRDLNVAGTDYTPPQLHPDYIDARTRPCHKRKTSGEGATTAGTDTGKIKKERKRVKAIEALEAEKVAIKAGWLRQPSRDAAISMKPRRWPPKGSTPMRRKPH